ncbi:LacI family DNA-binding transcriptional regulator [Labrys monachus]|uniref:LacI family transcriptional regulator n=1 Tax=Labrys monachus TaxID=217067 RepID=A0ABU0F8K7_9HYPH|nr:LacI family DNA-binding transcriptional regulator [Labrys monachus]MDQ0390920.1 LacI family transcriptional regulator [Labrys monachus]
MTDRKKPTLRDIADAAGVSPATVSLVLNGKGEISGTTRARVLETMGRLKYRPRTRKDRPESSASLRFLKISKHGRTVNRDHSHFISDYIDGMSVEAGRRGYALEVVSHEEQSIDAIVASLAGTSARGLIALGTELSEADVGTLQGAGIPAVFIDTFYDVVDATFVNMNNEDAVFQVLSHFKSRKFRRIGFVASHVDTTNFRLRREAFFKNMDRLHLAVRDADVVSVESTLEGAYADAMTWLQGQPDLAECYFCTNDIMAYGFIKALREHAVRIPEDVAIIGFDNLPMSATLDPPLTTIDVSKRMIGYLAVAMLDDIINASEAQPAVKILVGARLIVRASDRARTPPKPVKSRGAIRKAPSRSTAP